MTTHYTLQEERTLQEASAAARTVTPPRVDYRRLWWAGLVAAVVAAVANVAVFWFATAGIGLPLYMAPIPDLNPAPLSVIAVIIASVVPAALATLLVALLAHWTRRPWPWFWSIAFVALLLSWGGPLAATADPITKVMLGVMHLVAAAAIVAILTALARPVR